MARKWFSRKRRSSWTPASAPGTLVHIGERRSERTVIRLIRWDDHGIEDSEPASISESRALTEKPGVSWIHVTGLHEVNRIGALMEAFGIHPLIQEDVLNTDHRPKAEDHDTYIFITLKEVIDASGEEMLAVRQFSLLLFPNLVMSFQEGPSKTLEPVLARILAGKGQLRKRGSDYLAWVLLDAIVDHYFLALNELEAHAEKLEEEVIAETDNRHAGSIHAFKQDVSTLHRQIRPTRDVIAAVQRSDSELFQRQNHVFYSDLYDHILHAVGMMEMLKEAASGLRDYHLAAVSYRMNEVMKVLTAFATIFLPLTFLAGIYGMNFDFMPELQVWWAYPALWAVFVAVTLVMVLYFKRKSWL